MTQSLLPVIDNELLQKKANEYAQKGAEETLKEFYSGYNSPYKKAIEDSLKSKVVDASFDIPDIIAVINEGISMEVDKIANAAIANTFLPLVKKFLVRAPAEMNFSEIMKEFIRYTDFEYNNYDPYDYRAEVTREERSFKTIEITNGDKKVDVNIYTNDYSKEKKSTVYTLPRNSTSSRGISQTMKISDGTVSLEMPFTKDVLHDEFTTFLARLIIAETEITIDTLDFDMDMFPERGCHC